MTIEFSLLAVYFYIQTLSGSSQETAFTQFFDGEDESFIGSNRDEASNNFYAAGAKFLENKQFGKAALKFEAAFYAGGSDNSNAAKYKSAWDDAKSKA